MLRKILVLVIMLAMCGSASGVMIFDMPGNRQTSSSEEDFRLEGGLRVSFWGIVRDMESEGEPKECVYTIFTGSATAASSGLSSGARLPGALSCSLTTSTSFSAAMDVVPAA